MVSRRLFLVGLVLSLGGCSFLEPRPDGLERPERGTIQDFNLEGRLSVRQGENRHHVSLSWRHGREADEIFLSGPLGQGLAELSRDASGARLLTSDQKTVTASDWEGLSAQVFGAPLPLSNLPRWLLADLSASDSPTRDAQGRPVAATVEGWRIDYLDYESDAPNALPVLLEFRRDDMELRLKIDTWSLE